MIIFYEKYFNECIKLNRGFDLPNNKIKEGKYPIVASTNIKAYHEIFKIKGPGVVTGRSGSLGIVQYIADDFWPLNTSLYVKDFKGNNPKYIYYLLQTMNLENFNSGAGVPTLNQNHLHSQKIKIPNLSLQQRIASILSGYDNFIALNNQRIKLLNEITQELYNEWFVRMRFPNYKNTKFAKGIPEDVGEIKYFKDFVKLNRGFDLPEDKIQQGTYPVIASTSIKAYHNEFKVKAPIITTGRSGSLGKVLYVNSNGWPLNTSLYVKDFKGNEPLYVFYTLKQLDLESFNSGAGVPSLNQNHLHKIKLWVADIKLQEKFKKLVEPIFQQIEILEQQKDELQKIRDRLLPRLISGKLKVKPHNEFNKTESTESHQVNDTIERSTEDTKVKSNPFFQRRVLAAHIIDHLKDEPTFGHVKLMKLMYLCEHLVEIETASHYHRDAAGPYDNRMIRSIDSQLKKAQWFECKKTDNKYQYTTLPKKEEYKNWFTKYYIDKEAGIENLLLLFGKEKTEKAEMVATLYEAWRDLKAKKQLPTDQAIIYEVLNNWHESKQRISEERWFKCLQWMKEKNWIT
ncbi:restriction endonuclease subunit S [Pedobacter sp. MC2016-14]|uniref:restriction endonuclease subunit S n=1 Tax=Pedobacter sp. MC2016-14 TaxID=2897327 RepID=UPI001E3D66E2|nr:restriction endonuclease subunit S [Pedobacter sp. MC2016-14]MCD0489964.1 restriction endonuclease subunit S [Pedobacter sp. MC2016-14]